MTKPKTLRVLTLEGNVLASRTIPATLAGMQSLVDGGWLEGIHLWANPKGGGLMLYVDEDGRSKGLPPTLVLPGRALVRGPWFIAAYDAEGDNRSLEPGEAEAFSLEDEGYGLPALRMRSPLVSTHSTVE